MLLTAVQPILAHLALDNRALIALNSRKHARLSTVMRVSTYAACSPNFLHHWFWLYWDGCYKKR